MGKDKMRILLVDDEKMMADAGTKMLEQLGYKVTSANRSFDALSIFRKKPLDFDLVITDYDMPGMKGDELAAEMRLVRSNIPIILCTGCNYITDAQLQKWGFDALLLKPYEYKEIELLVAETLQKKAFP